MSNKTSSAPKGRDFIPIKGNAACCLISSFKSIPTADVLQQKIFDGIRNNVVFRYLLLNYLKDIYNVENFPNNLPYSDDFDENENKSLKEFITNSDINIEEFNELAKIAKKDTELFIKSRDEEKFGGPMSMRKLINI